MDAETLARYDERLQHFLRLNTFPVAVRFCASWEEVPAKARRPGRDLKNRFTTCQAIHMVRRFGWTLALGREDSSCVLGAVALGFEKRLPLYEEGNLCAEMYTADLAAGRASEESVPRLAHRSCRAVAMAPLGRAAFEPHVVVIYGNGAQVMRLGQAALWKRGGTLTSEFRGRIDCAETTIAPFLSGKPQMVVPCTGDRIFGGVQDHEVAFSFPFSMMEEILEGLEGTHRGGIRYPVTHFMAYTGQFPPKFDELYERLRAEDPEEESGAG
ncbi:MAG: DUF169 domain-containing protein [Nitrospinota bacterium]